MENMSPSRTTWGCKQKKPTEKYVRTWALTEHSAAVTSVAQHPPLISVQFLRSGQFLRATKTALSPPRYIYPHFPVLPHQSWLHCWKLSSEQQSEATEQEQQVRVPPPLLEAVQVPLPLLEAEPGNISPEATKQVQVPSLETELGNNSSESTEQETHCRVQRAIYSQAKMGFWSLLEVASMPVIQFLLIGMLGAFLASSYSNILSPSARKDINKVAFYVFSPSLVFSSLAKSVTLRDLISWWFMPVNIGIIFLIGGTLGWIVVKILKPGRHLEGLVIGSCSAANLGNLVLILVPAICNEAASPFGDAASCRTRGLSYVSLSMSLGNVYIWTYTYRLMRKSGTLYNKMREESNAAAEICSADEKLNGEAHVIQIEGNGNGEAHVIKIEGNGNCNGDTHINEIERKCSCDDKELLGQPPVKSTIDSVEDVKSNPQEIHNEDTKVSDEDHIITIHGKGSKNNSEELIQATTVTDVQGNEKTRELVSGGKINKKKNFRAKFKGLNKMLEELFAPPTIAAIIGLFVGAIPWLKKLIIGTSAPLRVIEDTISTLGNALLPCTILILGGNLTQGIKKSTLKPLVVIVIMVVRYVLLPIAGIGVVKAAGHLGFLPHDPLYRYVLMIQFALPPAMSIGTMAQLFDVAKEECSVIFLWTYLAAMLALTIWPTIFMSILS